MQTPQEFTFVSSDHQSIHAYRWSAPVPPVACVQIVHGMAEYALRYCGFAEYLNHQGIAVYANDHRGHGKTAGSLENRGFFAGKNGWSLCVEDLSMLNKIIHEENPGLPVFMFGHSMGSFLARSYLLKYSDTLAGCILSGTATHGNLLLNVGLILARIQELFMGKRHYNKLLNQMSFGSFNKRIEKPDTDFDWLTRDPKIVTAYVADDYCGFVCTTGFFIDLFKGLKIINKVRNIQTVRKELPVLFISGTEDPVGNYRKGVEQAVAKFSAAGIRDLSLKFYEGGRHEMLNELNKEEVMTDLQAWINKHIKK